MASATSAGRRDFPVPDTPARITNGLVRSAARYAATCHGSKTKPRRATASTTRAVASVRSHAAPSTSPPRAAGTGAAGTMVRERRARR